MPIPKFFPVIHLRDDAQGLYEAEKSLDAGADGAFFIHHSGDDDMAVRVAQKVKHKHSDWYVGINLLAAGPIAAFERAIAAELNAIWADSVGVSNTGLNKKAKALRNLHMVHPFIDVFGGVAFKYQPHDPDPNATIYHLSDLGWIPCTSGRATGVAADIGKVEKLSNASSMGLALASGVTLDNVEHYRSHVSHFLVATDISEDTYTLDFERMSAMAGRIHGPM